MSELETPDDPESLYLARGEEVTEHRPTFTGDVYDRSGNLVMVLQHPCALRSRGVDLQPRILVATVAPATNPLPRKWAGSYKIMPLPQLADGNDYTANFVDLDLFDSAAIPDASRIAILSQLGVNLLMQRWTFHNTRVAIPTSRYSESTIGPFDEADLIEEWVGHRVDEGGTARDAFLECGAWLDVPASEHTRRELLADAQHRSSIRREARVQCRASKLGDTSN